MARENEKIPAVVETDIWTGRKQIRAVGHAVLTDDINMGSFGEYNEEE